MSLKEGLRAAVNGAPVEVSLGALARAAVAAFGSNTQATFYLAEPDSSQLKALVGMPDPLAECGDALRIDGDALAGGLATATGEQVLTRDVRSDPRWAPWLALAETHGVRACWSLPVRLSLGRTVGALAVYLSEPRQPSADELEFADLLAHAAALILAGQEAAKERDHVDARLRAREQRYAFMARLHRALRPLADPIAVMETASRLLGTYLEADGVAYCQIEPTGTLATVHHDWTVLGTRSLRGRYSIDELGRLFAGALRAGQPLAIVDAEHDPRTQDAYRAAWAPLDIRAVITWPLVKHGRLEAAFIVHTRHATAWSKDDASLVGEVAERLWAALQQVHAEAASRAADAHARQHLRELEAVYASAPVGLCLIDRELRYVRINERLAEMNGVSAAAHLGRTVREMVPGLADVAEPAFRHVMATGEPVIDVELRGETPAAPGVERVWLESWYPMRNAEGNIVGVNVSALEVTERTRAEEALRDADRRKSDFLAILAHELRTPLAPIRTALSILQTKGIDDPACASAIGVLERQVTQMVRLIDDLLDVSRIGRGKLELRKERIDLASVVTGAAEAAQPTCASKRHTLQVAMPPEPIRVHADPARLLQVLANLLNNACKFTLPGGRIDLSLAREGEQVLIRVRDNGIGIAAEELPNVFNLFAQAPEALERAAAGGAGLGIGLALARTLVQMHGGELCAQSAGRWLGSEFVVRLPLEHEPTDLDAPPASTASGQATARRILVVDDHQDAVESLAMLLEISGHTAYTARDGEEALRTAEKTRPDVVLLDLDLPLIDGYEVCRRLRAHPWGKDALLVAVSGWAREKDRTRAREAGFDAHLAKPLELDQLLAFLASAPLDRAASSSLVGLPKRTGK